MVKRSIVRSFAVIALMVFLAFGYLGLSTDTASAAKPDPDGSTQEKGKDKEKGGGNSWWD